MLRDQYRMAEAMAKLMFTHFYNGELHIYPSTTADAQDRRDRVAVLIVFNWTEFGADSPTMFINVENRGAVNMEGIMSKYNNYNISLVVNTLAAIIAGEVIQTF